MSPRQQHIVVNIVRHVTANITVDILNQLDLFHRRRRDGAVSLALPSLKEEEEERALSLFQYSSAEVEEKQEDS